MSHYCPHCDDGRYGDGVTCAVCAVRSVRVARAQGAAEERAKIATWVEGRRSEYEWLAHEIRTGVHEEGK